MQYLGVFCIWLISLSIISPRFIHAVANGKISFFLKTQKHSIVYTDISHFLHAVIHQLLPCLTYYFQIGFLVQQLMRILSNEQSISQARSFKGTAPQYISSPAFNHLSNRVESISMFFSFCIVTDL